MKYKFLNIKSFKINKKETDSHQISINIINQINNFVHQKIFIDLINEFSEIQNIPTDAVIKKSKQIINAHFNYQKNKFNDGFKFYKIFKDFILYLLIIIWGSIFSKKTKLKKISALIIDDIGDEMSFLRHEKLMKLFPSCTVITNNYKSEFKHNKIEIFNYSNFFIFSSMCFYKNKIKNIKFLIKLFIISSKYNFNFLFIFKIILFSSCKYKTLFGKYQSKYLIHDRFYRTCPIRNYYFKKMGGALLGCTQKNMCETTISHFVYIDILFSLGDESFTKKRLLELGGDIKISYPVGSLFLEHKWFSEEKDLDQVQESDIIILGLNPNTWLYVNDLNHLNYERTILDWIKKISIEFPKYTILIKHHSNLGNNEHEKSFLRGSSVQTQIATKSKNASYGYLYKSKIAFSFGSTMVLEGISMDKQCFFLDPEHQNTCFFKGLTNLEKIRIKSYEDFKKIAIETIESKKIHNFAKDSLCLKSDKVSNRIFEYLTNIKDITKSIY